MAVYDLEEQDQLEDLKAWWKQWGNTIAGVVIAVCVGVIGVQGWRWWSQQQAEKAFGPLQRGQRGGARERRREGEGRDGAARRQVRRHRLCAAGGADRRGHAVRRRRQGRERRRSSPSVIDRDSEDELKQIARLRLAAMLLRRQAVRRRVAHARRQARRRVRRNLRGHARRHPRRRRPQRRGARRVPDALARLDPKSPYRNYRAGEARHAGRRRFPRPAPRQRRRARRPARHRPRLRRHRAAAGDRDRAPRTPRARRTRNRCAAPAPRGTAAPTGAAPAPTK